MVKLPHPLPRRAPYRSTARSAATNQAIHPASGHAATRSPALSTPPPSASLCCLPPRTTSDPDNIPSHPDAALIAPGDLRLRRSISIPNAPIGHVTRRGSRSRETAASPKGRSKSSDPAKSDPPETCLFHTISCAEFLPGTTLYPRNSSFIASTALDGQGLLPRCSVSPDTDPRDRSLLTFNSRIGNDPSALSSCTPSTLPTQNAGDRTLLDRNSTDTIRHPRNPDARSSLAPVTSTSPPPVACVDPPARDQPDSPSPAIRMPLATCSFPVTPTSSIDPINDPSLRRHPATIAPPHAVSHRSLLHHDAFCTSPLAIRSDFIVGNGI